MCPFNRKKMFKYSEENVIVFARNKSGMFLRMLHILSHNKSKFKRINSQF